VRAEAQVAEALEDIKEVEAEKAAVEVDLQETEQVATVAQKNYKDEEVVRIAVEAELAALRAKFLAEQAAKEAALA